MSSGRLLSGVPDAAGVAGGQPRHPWRTSRRLRGPVACRGQVVLFKCMAPDHKVLIYIYSTTLYSTSPRRNWDCPNPSPASEIALPPGPKGGGGHTRRRLRGWGSPISDDWRKSLALCLLCTPVCPHHFHACPDPFFSVKMLNFYLIERRLYAIFFYYHYGSLFCPLVFFHDTGIIWECWIQWIRITLISIRMLIRIRLITLMRIRILNFIWKDPDLDPSFPIKAQTLEKVLK